MKTTSIEKMNVEYINPDSVNFSTLLEVNTIHLTLVTRTAIPPTQAEGVIVQDKETTNIQLKPKNDGATCIQHMDLTPLNFIKEKDRSWILSRLEKIFN